MKKFFANIQQHIFSKQKFRRVMEKTNLRRRSATYVPQNITIYPPSPETVNTE